MICGRTVRASDDPLAVVNPTVLVEVTSDSTEQYDHGAKLEHYRRLPSVDYVLIVSHREPRLTLHYRERVKDAWTTTEAQAGETIALEGLFHLTVDDVYRDGLERI